MVHHVLFGAAKFVIIFILERSILPVTKISIVRLRFPKIDVVFIRHNGCKFHNRVVQFTYNMTSTYCYICDQYIFRSYEQLNFMKCKSCTEKFLLEHQVFNKITAAIIENNNIDFRNFSELTVYRYDDMNKSITELAKKPTRTVLKILARDIFTLGGTKLQY